MRKILSLLVLAAMSLTVSAANADWYLYVWSDTSNSGSDVGQFQTTGIDGVYVLEGVTTTESGLKYCIHNSGWGTIYGWSTGSEGSVSYTGTEVALGTTSGVTGWLDLDAGTYDVTFKSGKPSVQFDTPVPAVGNGSKKVSILGDSYSTYYGYLRPYTNKSWYSTYTTQYYSDNDVTTVEQTWWYKFITAGDYLLERNNSYSGTTMVNGCLPDMDVTTSFISRALDLGDPDIIFIFGGTNDWWNNNSFSLGEYKYSDWTDDEKAQFRPGFAYLLNLVKTTYAGKEIYFILNDLISDSAGGSSSTSNVRTSIKTICEHYDIPIIELENIAKGSYHPTEAGMTSIATQVASFLDEDDEWYVSNASSGWGLTQKFTQSATDNDVFTYDSFIPTAEDFDQYGGLYFCIATPEWAKKYVCNSNITDLGTEYNFVLSTTEGAWENAYCKAMAAGNSYKLTWNRNTHQLKIEKNPVSYNLIDGRAVATVEDYLRGGDISMLNYVESFGAKFKHADGTEDDPLDIMQENGCNIVRLRLYNNPGQEISYTKSGSSYTYKLPAGYLDETDVLSLARRAKAHNMKIELTFHYSDFWSNGEIQFKPSDWTGYNFNELKQAVYDYTYAFLQKMNAQGTAPDYVSLGNEIQAGLLFGHVSSVNSVNGYCSNMTNVAALLAQGSAAVRAACPNAKVVIHLTMSEDNEYTTNASTYKWFFDAMRDNSLDYDIIGASYYPYWTNQKPSYLNSFVNTLYDNYGKDVLIMEVGYSWTQYRPYGRYNGNHEGQLHMNGSVYNEASQEGQKSFMQELQTVIKNNSHILGYLYWDPVMLEQQVNSSWIKTAWAFRKDGSNWWEDGNLVGNTTLFDYEGKALPVFEAIAEDAVSVPDNVIISGTSYTVEQEEPYTLTIGDTGYATFYDSWARTLPDGLTAYKVESVSDNHLTLTDIEMENIPAETGVLLQGSEGTYYLWPLYNDNSTVTGNMLYGTTIEQTIATPVGNYCYYKLANDKAKNGLGWYWGADDGGVFINGAHKAYLALLRGQANARSFISLFDNGYTGINEIVNSKLSNSKCFDLQGCRVVNPTKGLYIVGGKKVIVK